MIMVTVDKTVLFLPFQDRVLSIFSLFLLHSLLHCWNCRTDSMIQNMFQPFNNIIRAFVITDLITNVITNFMIQKMLSSFNHIIPVFVKRVIVVL